jgi:uncharacterized protein
LTILVDANLLIYAYNNAAVQHEAAKDWLERCLAGRRRVGLPWSSLLAFLRVVTHPRFFSRPVVTREAWTQVGGWLSSDVAWTPLPTERHAELLAQFLVLPGIGANLVHDADLAVLAIEHSLVLCSNDGDFARFPSLRWENPLAG